MQPLINLKQFLAVLLLLIIPAAFLTAYFRNYDPQAGGHQHSEAASNDAQTGQNMKDMKGMQGEQQAGLAQHSPTLQPSAIMTVSRIEAIRAQLEAIRMQLEESRIQLEASRKALEAVRPPDHAGGEKKPEIVPPPRQTAPAQQDQPPSDGHAHKH